MNKSNKINITRMECEICGYIYDESKGSIRHNVPPGTPFSELDDDWVCPDCQVGKEYFIEV